MPAQNEKNVVSVGWGNQPRVSISSAGVVYAPEKEPLSAQSLTAESPASVWMETLLSAGDALYRLAAIIDDQTQNPFSEAKVPLVRQRALLTELEAVLSKVAPGVALPSGMGELQSRQLRASGSVVLLSVAEAQQARSSKEGKATRKRALELGLQMLEQESDPLLAERMAINLDWLIPSLPPELQARARKAMEAWIPAAPPYDAWFADGKNTLVVDWKCGPEFLSGWVRRLQEEKFVLETDGGSFGESILARTFVVKELSTTVRITIGPERSNVFRKMNNASVHLIGYDGHSDWGRKIPRSLTGAPPAQGAKVIMYLLCCGKQILQRVRDIYPRTPLITTFNSSRFTHDFRYSEDFSAFINVMQGIARRETWAQIRDRVNKDWYNNPEANYLFPNEALLMARSLDRDHDGQADMFDKLIDYNTFAVAADARAEFTPRVPETPASKLVGTRLHFGVQVFHTLCHFNQLLEPFTKDLRVFSEGWFDPNEPAAAGVLEWGPTRVRVVQEGNGVRYGVSGSTHFAHATEETWRAFIILALSKPVLAQEPNTRKKIRPAERLLLGLLLVAQSLEVDDAFGRDGEVWRQLLPLFGLPSMPLDVFQRAKKADEHWYAGSRASLDELKNSLSAESLEALALLGA